MNSPLQLYDIRIPICLQWQYFDRLCEHLFFILLTLLILIHHTQDLYRDKRCHCYHCHDSECIGYYISANGFTGSLCKRK